jgi:hypothetical protein
MESNLIIMETIFPQLFKSKSNYGFGIEENPETEAQIRNHLKQIAILALGSFVERYLIQDMGEEMDYFFPDHLISKDTLKVIVDLIDDEKLKKIYSENFHERDVFSIIKSMFLPD